MAASVLTPPGTCESGRRDSFEFLTRSPAQRGLAPNSASDRDLSINSIGALASEFPFLRAEHSFDASVLDVNRDSEPHTVCLSFSVGDVVFAHWVHESGWGDVTILHSGKRGWIPVNYFTHYTDAKALPLLSAAANFISAPKSYRLVSEAKGRGSACEYTFSQAAINEVVSGVRSLLDHTGTLNRDSPLTQRSEVVRRYRKTLLTELAYLVSLVKQNKKTTDNAVIDKLVRGCYRIVNKTITLLDAWSAEQPTETSEDGQEDSPTPKALVPEDTGPSPESHLDAVQIQLNDHLEQLISHADLANDPAASVHILTNTRHCMLVCRELLVVVESISSSCVPRDATLEGPKNSLFSSVRQLVSSARQLVATHSLAPEQILVASRKLTSAARECSRVAQECATGCHTILDKQHARTSPYSYSNYATAASLGDDGTKSSCSGSDVLSDRSSRPSSIESSHTLSVEHAKHNDTKANRESMTSACVPFASSGGPITPERSPTRLVAEPAATHEFATNDACRTKMGSCESTPSSNDNSESKDGSSCRSTSFSSQASQETGDTVVSESAQPIPPRKRPLAPPLIVDTRPTPGMNSSSTLAGGVLDIDAADPELLIHNGKVRGGSVPALVAWVTSNDTPEFTRMVFLLTFRLFTTSREVCECLAARCLLLSTAEMGPIGDFMVLWLESFWQTSDNEDMTMISAIVDNLADSRVTEALEKRRATPEGRQAVTRELAGAQTSAGNTPVRRQSLIRYTLTRRQSNDEVKSGSSGASWGSAFRFGTSESTKILDYDPLDLACQLYYMDCEILRKLKAEELLDQRYCASKRSLGLSPNVVQLILVSNHLAAFVGDTVLGGDNLSAKTRKNIIRTWIRIAEKCYELGNLNSLVTIISALQSSHIGRLRKTWDLMPPKYMATFERLKDLAAPDKNFAALRQELRQRAGSPCMPYVGLYLSDLTLIDEGNPKSRVVDGHVYINFDRYYRAVQVIAGLQGFQLSLSSGGGISNNHLASWLRTQMAKSHSTFIKDIDNQWRRSCIIEPRASP